MDYTDIDKQQKDCAGFVFDYGPLLNQLLSRVPPNGLVVELGCFLGCSTVYIAEFFKRRKQAVRFYTCDAFQTYGTAASFYGTTMTNLKACGVRDNVHVVVAVSWDTATLFDNGEVDFVWVDAGHDYASVQRDLNTWLPKLKSPAGLAGHDYSEPSVKRAVDEFAQEHGLQVKVYNPASWQSWYFDL